MSNGWVKETHAWSASGGSGMAASFGVIDKQPLVVSDGRCVAVSNGLRFASSAIVARRCILGEIGRVDPRRGEPLRVVLTGSLMRAGDRSQYRGSDGTRNALWT